MCLDLIAGQRVKFLLRYVEVVSAEKITTRRTTALEAYFGHVVVMIMSGKDSI